MKRQIAPTRSFGIKIYSTLILVVFLFHFSSGQVPAPVACYNFSGNLSEANGGNAITAIGAGTYSAGATVCGVDSFYNWSVGQGLNLSIGSMFPKNNYTIELLFKFTSIPYQRSWQRIVDFKSNTSDMGFYSYGSGTDYNLQMYTQYTGTTDMAAPNTWLHVFLTRDAATGLMNAFINDSLQISFNDNLSAGVFTSNLILFKDDIVVSGEESAGAIDYLRIYNQPLTKAQIHYIVNTEAPAISITGNLSVCQGDSTLLSASGATNYLWSNGATSSSVYVRPSTATTYSLLGWNNLFCTKSCMTVDSVTVDVNAGLVIIAGPDTAVCEGEAIQLMANGGDTYKWAPAANLTDSSIANPIAMPFETTTYTVTGQSGACSGTTTVSITVRAAPATPTITQSLDSLFCSFDTGYISYQWYAGGSAIAGGTAPFLVITSSGNYNVQVTDENGCSVAVGINVVLTGNLPSIVIDDNTLNIFPNPVRNRLSILSVRFNGQATLDIFNTLGEKVLSVSHFFREGSSEAIDISSLVPGVYYLQCSAFNDLITNKFVKQ